MAATTGAVTGLALRRLLGESRTEGPHRRVPRP
jgi:hypothetical protein